MFLIKSLLHEILKHRNMSIFVQKLNPITGVNDWVLQSEDYDYHQEVARSSFADMLHDRERNQLYEIALKEAIEKMHANGKQANVLDIGTGTGLLSMMAVRHGADTVTACEAFKPMSECASKIIKLNGYQDKIKIIPKRSTEITSTDLPQRCNILVTEVFDTELIGEGALSTFSHAHKNLLEPDCIVVPQSATIFAQIVECPLAQNWNKLKDIVNDDAEILIQIPNSIKNCPGTAAVHDIQLSQLPSNSINTIVGPTPVLQFDWSGRTPFVFNRSTITSLTAEKTGVAQAIFMWWELVMDLNGKVILSCAPHWAHPRKCDKEIPWRDHWMQAIYYFPKEIPINRGDEINLISTHDEYSLWFNLSSNLKITDHHYTNPICDCTLHVAFSRTRISQMNDQKRNKKFIKFFRDNLDETSTVLVLGDGFYTSLAAIKLGVKQIFYVETNNLSRKILRDFIDFNRLNDKVQVIESLNELKDVDLSSVNVVMAEPYFVTSILPWDNLLSVYLVKGVQKLLKQKNVKIFPKKAVIKAVAVSFKDLYKIRSPLGECEGFLMKDFDDLIEESSKISDDNVEAQPLWEYPCLALSEQFQLASIDLMNLPQSEYEIKDTIEIKWDATCNGVVLWIDWWMGDDSSFVFSTGPVRPIEIGQKIEWDMNVRQGVTLFKGRNIKSLNYEFQIDFNEGNISFKCS